MCNFNGLTQTSAGTSQASFPAMMAYNQAMSRISAATSKPFQRYSSDPSAYVAGLNPIQQQAISNVAGMQGMTDPYYQAAAGLTGAGAQGVGRLTGAQIQEYMSPYISQVIDPVRAAVQQQSGQQLAQQQAEAIRGGAFGGERAGLQRQTLRGQQALGLGQALSPLYQTGYGQALQTAAGQQAVEAANLQRLLGAGAQFGQLGTAAQQAALQQAQAQLQASTLQQQTETAQKQAMYGEFQKERMYPLQVAQLYAQTAGALGPLYGSQTAGYQQLPFFGGLAANGGAIKGYDEGLGRARMGGAVHEEGDFARGGYADGGSPDFSYLVEQHRAGIMPRTEDVAFPTGEFRVGEAPKMGELPERRQSPVNLSNAAALAKAGFEARQYQQEREASGKPASWTDIAGHLFTGKAEGGQVDNDTDAMGQLLSSPIQTGQAPQAAQAPEKKGSGLLGSLAKMGASAAANYFLPGSGAVVSGGLSALGMADGGRAEYAEGGVSPSDTDLDYMARTMMREDPRNMEAIGHVMMNRLASGRYGKTIPDIATAPKQFTPWNPEMRGTGADPRLINPSSPRYQEALGAARRVMTGESEDPTGGATHFYNPKLASPKWGPGMADSTQIGEHVYGKADAGAGLGRVDRSLAGIPKGDPRREIMASATQPTVGGIVPVKQEGAEPTDWRQVVLPALAGLGAMAGSRSKYLGSALLEGMGAGAKSYMDVGRQIEEQKKLAEEVGTQRETTGLVREEAGKTAAGTLKDVLESGRLGIQQFGPADAPYYIVTLEDGTRMPLEQWMEKGGNLIGGTVVADLARRLGAGKTGAAYQQAPAAAAAVETARDISKVPEGTKVPVKEAEGVPTAKPAVKQPPLTTPPEAPKLTPGVVYDDESRKAAKEDAKLRFGTPQQQQMATMAQKTYAPVVMTDAQTARDNTPYLNELSETLASAYKGKGAATPGYGAAVRSQAIKAADTLYRALGGEGSLSNLPRDADITGKITSLLGRQGAASAGQESYAALNAIREAIPNLEMDPRAGAKLAAELMVLRKRSLDREEHMKAWTRDSGGVLYNAQKNFSEKNPDAKYQVAQKVIADMMVRHPDAFERIMSGTVPRSSVEKQLRAQYGAGIPEGISEFFPSLETTRRKTP